MVIVLSVLLWYTASYKLHGILWSLYFLSFNLQILITPVVSCVHCVVCPSSIYGFWLPLWYLVVIVLSVLLQFTASDYPCGILWSLYCLFFFNLRLLITPLVSCGHCVVCPSSIYGFWLPLWYLVVIVLSVLLQFTASDYPCGIFKHVLRFWSMWIKSHPTSVFNPLCICIGVLFYLCRLVTLKMYINTISEDRVPYIVESGIFILSVGHVNKQDFTEQQYCIFYL